MSKPIKELIIEDYRRRFRELDGALIVDMRGVGANKNNSMRLSLSGKAVRITILKNTLARKAFEGTALQALSEILEGPSALAYGAESVVDLAREIIQWTKKVEHLRLKGAVLDGELYAGEEGVRRLSLFPTRDEAKARIVQLALSPARKAVGCATGPGARILGIVKEIEKRLEKGQPIARVA